MQLGILSRIRLIRSGSGFYGLDDREITVKCAELHDSGDWVVATEALPAAIRREKERSKEIEEGAEAVKVAYKASVHRQVQKLLDEADPRWSQIAYRVDDKMPGWKQFTEKWVALAPEYGVRPHPEVGVPWQWVKEAVRRRILALERVYADRLRAEGPPPELARLLDEMAAKERSLQAADEDFDQKERALRDRHEAKAAPLRQEIAALRDQVLEETPERVFPPPAFVKTSTSGQILAFMSPRR